MLMFKYVFFGVGGKIYDCVVKNVSEIGVCLVGFEFDVIEDDIV